jgi:hypothetical protein
VKRHGRFKKGRDPRRHQLTTEDRRKGFAKTFNLAMYERPELLLWLRNKLRASRRKS